jgi:hypothetical protein
VRRIVDRVDADLLIELSALLLQPQPYRVGAGMEALHHVALAANPLDVVRRRAGHRKEKQGLPVQLDIDRHSHAALLGSSLQARAERPGGGRVKALELELPLL